MDVALAPSAHALELARTLVRMDTVSRNSNLALIHFIRDELARHGVTSTLTFDDERQQGQPLRHRRRRQAGRRDRLRPHRHRALGRPGLVARPALRRGEGRPPLRPRQRRHEGLHRPGGRADAGLPGGRPAVRDPLRLQLRRGGRLLRRAAPDRRPARARHRAAGLHRRRADRHGAGAGAQGRVPLALLHQGQGGALVAHAAGGQRDRGRRARGRQALRHVDALPRAGAALRGLRRALHDRRGRRHRGRHRRQRRARGLPLPLRVPQPAGQRRRARCRPR